MTNDNREPTEYPSSIVVIWVFLEGTLRPVKLKASLSEFTDLDDFSSCTKQKFKDLRNVEPSKLIQDRLSSDTCCLMQKFLFSSYRYLMPHTSGSWSLLRKAIVKRFDNLLVENFYFVNNKTEYEITDEFQFNLLLSETKPNKEVFQDVLKQDHNDVPSQLHLNENTWLSIKIELDGNRGYGYADYAQCIMKMHTVAEELGKCKHDKSPTIFGIVTTGRIWRFIHWTGSLERSMVEVSMESMCEFKENMKGSKEVLEYIIRILQAQVTSFQNNNNRDNEHVSKHNKLE
ncbi:9914_t:CDS:2 [Gigaspora margarita]|uniref:9914_t:CDS:1 n=1 Tax=Gigaspora margarita TaxID=4874 RepID=A0ABM8VYP7_GIGMA|nr:9914_t:CDS:2 [Gigaspora margarita]